MVQTVAIHWFRQDLRLSDNPGFREACQSADRVLPLYILDEENLSHTKPGAASRVWLHHSLQALDRTLKGHLVFLRGNPLTILQDLIQQYSVVKVCWNRCYEPEVIKRDTVIKNVLQQVGMDCYSGNASLLWEPWSVQKQDGSPYRVFTPFYRKGCLQAAPPRPPLDAPSTFNCVVKSESALHLDDLMLLPKMSWDYAMIQDWQIGEAGAQRQLDEFIDIGIGQYKEGRNFPAKPYTSRLSPHLHFGEISPQQIWHTVRHLSDAMHIDHFCSELGWREFSYSLLYHNPDLPTRNLQHKFDWFPWEQDEALLSVWQQGMTGVPMVDAGMRELWQTGYMHNRVRMIVGSFLVKNLRLHWRHGAEWFHDCLFDADLANNSASWQWVAGCGADAAPYFRIFNPVTQGQKFDPDGIYIKQYLPELAHLPTKHLYAPWLAPSEVLQAAGISLGEDYPHPVVDLKASREAALAAFSSLKVE